MKRVEVVMSATHRKWWDEQGIKPVVLLDERRIEIPGIEPIACVKNDRGGYYCYRRFPSFMLLGEVCTYGVRDTPTPYYHKVLSLARVALFPQATYPAPLCYELADGRLSHPGPCFARLRGVHVKTTKYHLSEDVARACCVCQGRFQ